MSYSGNLPSAYNRSAYDQPIGIDDINGNPLDLIGKTFTFEVADPETGTILITATAANGRLTFPALGEMRVLLPRSEMSRLCVQDYSAGITWSDATETVQLFAGFLPVNDGITA